MGLRAILLVSIVIVSTSQARGVVFQLVPHVAMGGPEADLHFETVLILSEPSGNIGGNLILLDDAGRRLAAFFNGQGPLDVFRFGDIPEVKITSASDRIQIGSLEASGTSPFLVISAKIRLLKGNSLISEVTVRSVQPPLLVPTGADLVLAPVRGVSIPFVSGPSRQLGLSILNPTLGTASLTLRMATRSISAESEPFNLGPREKVSKMINEFFPRSSLGEGPGTLEVRSTKPILVVAIQMLGLDMQPVPIFPKILANELFVSKSGDNNTGDGSRERPFRTITRAIQAERQLVSFDGWVWIGHDLTIHVGPGTYNAGSGEQFPLVLELRDRVVLAGDAKIEGGAPFQGLNAAIVIDGSQQATLEGLEITNPNPGGIGIWIRAAEAPPELERNRIRGNSVGVLVEDAARLSNLFVNGNSFHDNRIGLQVKGRRNSFIVRGNVFFNNETGLDFRDESRALIRDNFILANGSGVRIANASTVDLGSLSNPGGNILRGNLGADLCHEGSEALQATGNIWDNNPPSRSSLCAGTTDIGGPGFAKVLVN